MDLKQRETHFEFGHNWLSFIDFISEKRITAAVYSLEHLFHNSELQNKRFLDIGCGSGLSMLAAIKLGAREVVGVDIDEDSVEASTNCLGRFACGKNWNVLRGSVFDFDSEQLGRYDIVHSWGVLDFTGDLWLAVEKASALVADNGLLVFAVYRKTPFCGFWRREKYLYAHAPRWLQAPTRWLYQLAFLARKLTLRQNPVVFVRSYYQNRGMSWTHDVHDWLGGYPYESSTREEVHEKLSALGFYIVRENIGLSGFGLFGSGCNEYVARRE
ncbi:MAG: class I SAM-dependent methyltransferase [Nitrococcus sp.]|nr:class I SAM-dependent methyltransferase [Nitrococcus sp.]